MQITALQHKVDALTRGTQDITVNSQVETQTYILAQVKRCVIVNTSGCYGITTRSRCSYRQTIVTISVRAYREFAGCENYTS